jgi:hypothetical protein
MIFLYGRMFDTYGVKQEGNKSINSPDVKLVMTCSGVFKKRQTSAPLLKLK